MQNINYEQIIAVLGLSIWFIFPIAIFLSIIKQDRESLAGGQQSSAPDHDEHLKIFGHKQMLYNDESDESLDEPVFSNDDFNENLKEPSYDDNLGHPHTGIGSTHVHHIH